MTIRRIIQTALILLSVVACKGRQQSPSAVSEDKGKAGQEDALLFPDVKVPSLLDTDEERALYLGEHYWDRFIDPARSFTCNDELVSGIPTGVIEQHFSNYAGILGMLPSDEAVRYAGKLWEKMLACERKNPESNIFETMCRLSEKYFYDVNSPFRNEDIYYPIVLGRSLYEGYDEVDRSMYGFDAELCAMNKVGTPANDFTFKDAAGKTGHLYGIGTEYVLIFFSNPGCQACKVIMDQLEKSPAVTQLIASGRLAVVNMYIDEDLDAWKSYMPIYPDEWYNVYDPDYKIRMDMTYSVRAIPALYLLGKDKVVLMKDAVPEKVLWYLEQLA